MAHAGAVTMDFSEDAPMTREGVVKMDCVKDADAPRTHGGVVSIVLYVGFRMALAGAVSMVLVLNAPMVNWEFESFGYCFGCSAAHIKQA